MKSKKKLIIALSSFAFVLVAAVVTVVAVLAATTQTINSNVSVSYKAQEIAGTVSAKYQVLNEEEKDMTVDGTSAGQKTLTYDGTETNADPAKTLIPQGDIVLTRDNNKVVFTYTFTNTGDADYTAEVVYEDDYDASAGTGTEDKNMKALAYSTNFAGGTVEVPAGQTVEVTITVEIDNVALNAEFSGNFAWTLTGHQD